MERGFETLVKALLILLVLPFVVCVAAQTLVAIVAILAPVLLLTALVAGTVAGIAAGLALRRRLPRPRGTEPPEIPPAGGERIQRARGRPEGTAR